MIWVNYPAKPAKQPHPYYSDLNSNLQSRHYQWCGAGVRPHIINLLSHSSETLKCSRLI